MPLRSGAQRHQGLPTIAADAFLNDGLANALSMYFPSEAVNKRCLVVGLRTLQYGGHARGSNHCRYMAFGIALHFFFNDELDYFENDSSNPNARGRPLFHLDLKPLDVGSRALTSAGRP